MNTPYFEFQSSNFSEANMFSTGKTGESRDTSSRVTLYQETGLIHSYTIEASHVIGNSLNSVVGLSSPLVEEPEVVQGTLSPKYTQSVFADIGKGLLVALLDLKGWNPLSRLPLTQFHNAKGLLATLQRQIQIEIAERFFKMAFMNCGQAAISRDSGGDPLCAVMSALKSEDIPGAITIKDGRGIPVVTIRGPLEFLPLDQAVQLLTRTPPLCPPRTLLCSTGKRAVTQAGGGLAGRRSLSNADAGTLAAAALAVMGRKSLTGAN
ncbi:zinc carboxypeptidase [Trypanosoma conorhini]|uniref:Zinc carboxypeptidase n=1 Tax=Trypanosoma conorhini TaxID=83891 RepID=A0A422P3E9_9TRYP|nr:zinc carboxypeptidase [Trypanosoma conorhini]RNF12238.1 zinc carboxypeptidase [Trypanosoma conorhini]